MTMRFAAVVAVLLWAGVAFAQGQTPDASLPDASVGQSGADQNSEEADTNSTPCLSSNDCDGAFTCSNGRCVPAPVRKATGCGGGAAGLLGMVGVAALVRARRR